MYKKKLRSITVSGWILLSVIAIVAAAWGAFSLTSKTTQQDAVLPRTEAPIATLLDLDEDSAPSSEEESAVSERTEVEVVEVVNMRPETVVTADASDKVFIARTDKDFETKYQDYVDSQLLEAWRDLGAKLGQEKRALAKTRFAEGRYDILPPKSPGVPAEFTWSDENLLFYSRVPGKPSVESGEQHIIVFDPEEYPELYDVHNEWKWLANHVARIAGG